MKLSHALLRSYLLGQLQEDVEDRVEEALVSDAAGFKLYREAERQLVREYSDGTMGAADAELFERNCLVTVERRQKVAIVRALVADHAEGKATRAESASTSRPFVFGLAAAAVALAVGVYWSFRPPDSPKQVAEVTQPVLKQVREKTVVVDRPAVAPTKAKPTYLPAKPSVAPVQAPPLTETLPAVPEPQVLTPPPVATAPSAESPGQRAIRPGVFPGSINPQGRFARPGPRLATPKAIGPPTADVPLAPVTAPPNVITLPPGTEIAVRTISPIDSKRTKKSEEFEARLDGPIRVDSVEVVPANARAILRVFEASRTSMSLSLVAVFINGHRVDVNTDNVDSRRGVPARGTAAGAVVGAGTGAIAGAGTGAAIGAAAAGNFIIGNSIRIASETRFTYKITGPTVIKEPQRPSANMPTVRAGQTTDQVSAILGPPAQIIDLGGDVVYVYQNPKLRITFRDGKLIDVQ